MTLLILGLFLFFGIHMIPMSPMKQTLITQLGDIKYKLTFSLISVIGLGLIIYGKSISAYVMLWPDSLLSHWFPVVLMWPAFILLLMFYLPSNLKRRIKHPMSYAIILFSLSHLVANGDLSSALIFICFALYTLYSMLCAKPMQSTTTKVVSAKVNRLSVIMAIVIGTLVYAAFGHFHSELIGVAVTV